MDVAGVPFAEHPPVVETVGDKVLREAMAEQEPFEREQVGELGEPVNPWDAVETEVEPRSSLSDAAATFVQAKREKEQKRKARQRQRKMEQGADMNAQAQVQV